MFGELEDSQLEGALEALLFVSDEPVNAITLADMLETDVSAVQETLTRMAQARADCGSGIQVVEVAGGWRLYTHPAFHNLLEKYVLSWDTRRLTQAALETLAIIAYGQPITRQGIASIRGVNSDSSVNSLIDKGLVRESGPADAPGNPMTYSTTRTFLEKFSLSSVKDLPPLEDYAPDDETARYLRDGLLANAHSLLLPDEDALTGEDADIELSDSLDQAAQDAMRSMIADALAESAGVVEKIDFDQLDFEE